MSIITAESRTERRRLAAPSRDALLHHAEFVLRHFETIVGFWKGVRSRWTAR